MNQNNLEDVKKQGNLLVSTIRMVILSLRLLFSGEVPISAKIIPILASVAYAIWPVDVIPDPILGFGQMDDLSIVLIFMWVLIKLPPKDVVEKLSNK